ncbi:MAG: 4a-hydroxytetrahydrobiopterin dehydratase [Gammaproteobacteria bacterium]
MTDQELTQKVCTPCQGGIPPLDAGAVETLLAQAPGWETIAGHTKIRRHFDLPSFRHAMDLAFAIGELAEREGHHPTVVSYGWRFCDVEMHTKKIKGLHENDFIMAAKMNEIAHDIEKSGDD